MLNTKKLRRRATISLTPLIDVVFILLLFFMLTSSFLHMRQIDVSAATKSDDKQKDIKPPVIVKLLTDEGAFDVDGQSFMLTNTDAIAKLVKQKPEAVYIIQAKDGLKTQTLISTLDAFKKAGAKSVSLAGIN